MTGLLAVLVGVLPGVVGAFLLPRGPERWAALAAAPVVSAGLVALPLAWLTHTPLPDGPVSVLVVELVLATALALVGVALTHRARRADPNPTPGPRPWRDVAAAGLAAALPAAYGLSLVRGLPTTPGWDAINHAFFVRRMLDAGHASIETACVTGATAPHVACTFYPLAADVTWAQAVRLGGGTISAAMNTDAAVLAPVALVVGTFALLRYLGARTALAADAAMLTTFVGPLWPALDSGRVNEQLGPAYVPATALLLVLALRGRHRARLGLLAGLASAGIVLTHSYEALVVILIAVPAAFLASRREASTDAGAGGRGARRLVRVAGVATGLLTLTVALGPLVPGILSTSGDVVTFAPAFRGRLVEAVRFYVTDLARYAPIGLPAPHPSGGPSLNPALAVLALGVAVGVAAAVPGCLTRRLRWARPWVLAWAVLTGLGIWSGVSEFAAHHIGALWYNEPERLRVMTIPVLGVLTVAGWYAVGLAGAAVLARVWRGAPAVAHRAGPLLPRATAVATVAVVALAAWMPPERGHLRTGYVIRTPQGPQYARVYGWLADHVRPGGSVAFDRNIDFLAWAYGVDGVPPLYGPSTYAGPGMVDYRARRQVLAWLVGASGARPSGCLVRHYGVEYVAVGPPRLLLTVLRPTIDPARVAMSPNVRLVHSDGGLSVYAVTAAGAQCTG